MISVALAADPHLYLCGEKNSLQIVEYLAPDPAWLPASDCKSRPNTKYCHWYTSCKAWSTEPLEQVSGVLFWR